MKPIKTTFWRCIMALNIAYLLVAAWYHVTNPVIVLNLFTVITGLFVPTCKRTPLNQ